MKKTKNKLGRFLPISEIRHYIRLRQQIEPHPHIDSQSFDSLLEIGFCLGDWSIVFYRTDQKNMHKFQWVQLLVLLWQVRYIHIYMHAALDTYPHLIRFQFKITELTQADQIQNNHWLPKYSIYSVSYACRSIIIIMTVRD